jgi:2-hydroxy-3-keto-5-methylthiopentenyl-1-phosphate phosphatase|tara:strand:+ start:592 stop:837 length:246 start_codon:yes stop_codon:yes gene_type:complete
MSKLTTESKNILAEFVGSLMKAYARHGAKKTRQKIQNDPVIKKSLEKIAQLDKEVQQDIAKRIKVDPKFKKEYEKNVARGL